MAIKPATLTCDFCTLTIHDGEHFSRIEIPLPKSIRAEMVEYAEQEVLPHGKGSVFGGLYSVEAMVPQVWAIVMCVDCAFAILPNLRETLHTQVRDAIQRSLAAKRRTDESFRNMEPA